MKKSKKSKNYPPFVNISPVLYFSLKIRSALPRITKYYYYCGKRLRFESDCIGLFCSAFIVSRRAFAVLEDVFFIVSACILLQFTSKLYSALHNVTFIKNSSALSYPFPYNMLFCVHVLFCIYKNIYNRMLLLNV